MTIIFIKPNNTLLTNLNIISYKKIKVDEKYIVKYVIKVDTINETFFIERSIDEMIKFHKKLLSFNSAFKNEIPNIEYYNIFHQLDIYLNILIKGKIYLLNKFLENILKNNNLEFGIKINDEILVLKKRKDLNAKVI